MDNGLQSDLGSEESIGYRLREILSHKPHEDRHIPRNVRIIINPAAGKDQPILKTLNAIMQQAGVEWDIAITKEAGDGRRLAEEAVAAGADVVAVHGGDGTVMEVATGLIGSQVPLAIIPGGTANVMAIELGIPNDLIESCLLTLDPRAPLRQVDMGRIGEHYFMLRAGMGFEAAMVEGADRELKDRFGVLAYAISALQALVDPPVARYFLTLDGQEVESEGMTCMIANSGTMGAQGLLLAPGINVSDGLLDVVVLRTADLASILSVAASVVGGGEEPDALLHWQVREVSISADPVQKVQVDGEIVSETPITAEVIPHAVRVIVPPLLETVDEPDTEER